MKRKTFLILLLMGAIALIVVAFGMFCGMIVETCVKMHAVIRKHFE